MNTIAENLYKSDKRFVYKGIKTSAISFPLGGIGTGCIGLSGNGRLVDWEIFNRPNKNSDNGFTFFAVKAEHQGEVKAARILHGELAPPYMGSGSGKEGYGGYGIGVDRETMAGFPHFKHSEFTGEFPFAKIQLSDEKVPLDVTITAFNPFIPLNERDSSIPAAIFNIEIVNLSEHALDVTLAGALTNPFMRGAVNKYVRQTGCHAIQMVSEAYTESDVEYGDLAMSTVGEDVGYQSYWYRGKWFDNLNVFWNEFSAPGRLSERLYEVPRDIKKKTFRDVGMLNNHKLLRPGEKGEFRFVISWNFPNVVNYWNPGDCRCGPEVCAPPTWKNHYALRYANSLDSANYIYANWDRLYVETKQFKDTLFNSSYPNYVLEAISGNLSTLKSPTCLRLTDGTLYGFEGCYSNEGCCEGSCTHVWNYDQATPFLFPDLQRSMHAYYFKYNKFNSFGKMAFRMMLPPEKTNSVHSINNGHGKAAVDGQMGCIIRVYREWKISGDTEWMKSVWNDVKRTLEYAWSPFNEYGWDIDCDGVLEGVQHNTLDIELYGPNSYLTGMYICALLAASHMAEALGDPAAQKYHELYERGRNWVDEHLFNGEYYEQKLDLQDSRFPIDPELHEIKYQIGKGCYIDQVLAQWHAHNCGLRYILDQSKVRKALNSIYRYNFVRFDEISNPSRIYALNEEEGLVMCTWPHGERPKIPFPYADESMHGFEYQAACHMIFEGDVPEGLKVVKAIRDRYDGEKRNPWNEFECGGHYARSLASYSLLLALSGFEYDLVEGRIGFSPKTHNRIFRTFWCVGTGWGEFAHQDNQTLLYLKYGSLTLNAFNSELLEGAGKLRVSLNGQPLEIVHTRSLIRFVCSPLQISRGDILTIEAI